MKKVFNFIFIRKEFKNIFEYNINHFVLLLYSLYCMTLSILYFCTSSQILKYDLLWPSNLFLLSLLLAALLRSIYIVFKNDVNGYKINYHSYSALIFSYVGVGMFFKIFSNVTFSLNCISFMGIVALVFYIYNFCSVVFLKKNKLKYIYRQAAWGICVIIFFQTNIPFSSWFDNTSVIVYILSLIVCFVLLGIKTYLFKREYN